jgi:sugar phosphate isomerase/epimerase
MNIGIITSLRQEGNCFETVKHFGLKVCQLVSWDPALATREMAERVKQESKETGVRVSAMWAGFPGRMIWNFQEGPVTLGIVPEDGRRERMDALKKWADFAAWIGAPAIITHCGFIPENMTDPNYDEVVGINYDPANLILYGKGNPVDALDMIGPYIRNIHVKDGFYPTDGEHLGRQVAVGKGKVDFPKLLAGLKQLDFQGEWIIEREGEVGEDEKNRDIIDTIEYLKTSVNW